MGISQQQLQEFFRLVDSDGDGKVSPQEFGGPATPLLEGLTGGRIQAKFQDSGSISFEELKQLVQEAGNLE